MLLSQEKNSVNKPLINIIGAGALGKIFGKLIVDYGCGIIGSILNSTIQSTREAVKFINQGRAIHSITKLTPANITLITVPDPKIEEICHLICSANVLIPGSIVMHCSGILNNNVLEKARQIGCIVARVHPIKHIYCPYTVANPFDNIYCTYDGDEEGFIPITKIFRTLGACVIRLNPQKDSKYHAACVFVTAYPQILNLASILLFQECGINKNEAVELSINLCKQAIQKISSELDFSEFVEGPIRRMDFDTVKRNLSSITDLEIKNIYQSLGRLAVRFASQNYANKLKMLDLIENLAVFTD